MAMTEAKWAALQAAFDLVGQRQREGVGADRIIAELVASHGAKHRPRWDSNRLSCAGITSTCTGDRYAGLLNNWHTNAALRLVMRQMGAAR